MTIESPAALLATDLVQNARDIDAGIFYLIAGICRKSNEVVGVAARRFQNTSFKFNLCDD